MCTPAATLRESSSTARMSSVSTRLPSSLFSRPLGGQSIDGAYGRGLNDGRGVVGEGGDKGPGVVGIAGNIIARPDPAIPRDLWAGPFPGRGFHAGVVGLGVDPAARVVPGVGTTAIGVVGQA